MERATAAYMNEIDMTNFKSASLPSLERPTNWSDVTDALKGLFEFAKSEWSELGKRFIECLLRFVEDI
jgi:hypothetical protein